MKIEAKFNKRAANLVDVQSPSVRYGSQVSVLGVKVQFFAQPGDPSGSIAMHMTPNEALQFAMQLIDAARRIVQ